MNIYVYSDESGVFDKIHNKYYVFGGIVFVSKEKRDVRSRQYLAAERNIRKSEKIPNSIEVKACNIKAKSKNKLYRCVVNEERFGAVIEQKKLKKNDLFLNKKTKQRYLDWVYKMAIKKKFEKMIAEEIINPNNVSTVTFLIDEHSTATDGLYELRESLEKEFKIGMWNFEFMKYYKPLFPNVKSISVQYCNSSKKILVRAADIIANHIFYNINANNGKMPKEDKLSVYYHP